MEPDDPREAPHALCEGSRGPGSSTAMIVGAGGACVLGSAEVVVVVVMGMVAGMGPAVLVAALRGVVVVVLDAVGSIGGALSLAPSAPAAALAAMAMRSPPTREAYRCLRLRRRTIIPARSTKELHPAIAAPGTVVQP